MIKTGKTPTSSPREPAEKINAYINLLPAPTSARFVGKMHKLKTEIDRKREEEGSSSRRSSVAPKAETITETKETESALNTPREGPSRFPTASKAMVKMGEISKKFRKVTKNEYIKSEETPRSFSPTTPRCPSASLPLKKETVSPTTSRKGSPFMKKRSPRRTGLNAFKAKGLSCTKKNQLETPPPFDTKIGQNRVLKPRLFFIERNELTDEEVLNNIGKEEIPKETCAELKSKGKDQKKDKEKKKVELGIAPSIFYAGKLRNRLSETRVENTKYLGEMTYLKDKRGLYTGSFDTNQDIREAEDNPIFVALERVQVRAQLSLESRPHSRGVSRASPGSQRSLTTFGQVEKETSIGEGDIVGVLRSGLSPVRTPIITEWNCHQQQVRGDKKLKKIFIPF